MCPAAESAKHILRQRWHLTGQVQGVGFRPFVYRIAQQCGVSGFVLNDRRGVTIEAQGSAAQLKRFSRALKHERPPLALIDQIIVDELTPCPAEEGFSIAPSKDRHEAPAEPCTSVATDAAVCPACLAEIRNPKDRRYAYPLTNCTDCGPRYTIIERVPYDRPNTTMRRFSMCPRCRSEYTNPADRRYHAQPIACHDCGPTLSFVDPEGRPIDGDPVERAAKLLQAGGVVAIKGLGGFHLAVRADDEQAVSRLRQGKRREYKPFALMCRSYDSASSLVHLSGPAGVQLRSAAAPIVLAPRRRADHLADSVAPDNHRLGVMLPYTPVHHLIFDKLNPSIDALVMTSANPSGEPLTIDNQEALDRLGELCDALLWHDRPIYRRVDDSVLLDMAGMPPLPIRRARGYVPLAIRLPESGDDQGLCIGAELKNTIALVRDGKAILSQHLGDLSDAGVFEYQRETILDLIRLFDIRPKWIAHDLHPGYLGSRLAKQLSEQWDVPLVPVQHHHAHAAAVMAEYGRTGPTLALVCDGVGYGEDGGSWGGELLLADLFSSQRLAHLSPIQLIGGDAAAVDTRRCGLALLQLAYGDAFDSHPASAQLIPDEHERQIFSVMLRRRVNCATTTALGRYFDGVAALLGLSMHNHFEAQSAMRLESEAFHADLRDIDEEPLFRIVSEAGQPDQIDLSLLVRTLVDRRIAGDPIKRLAAVFHDQVAWALSSAVLKQVERTDVRSVVLSGGVFCNERLTRHVWDRLIAAGLEVMTHRMVPANDGGLALGQAAIALARWSRQLAQQERAGALCV